MLVYTTEGPVEHDRLTVVDHATMENGNRVIATEWHLDGVLVRRDVWVSLLMPQAPIGAEQGGM